MPYRPELYTALACLIAASCNAFAQSAPPATPLDRATWRAALKQHPQTDLRMGRLHIKLEQMTLDDIRRAASAGEIAHRGDAGASVYWLCYTSTQPEPRQRIWLVSDGEMGSNQHAITRVSAEVSPDAQASAQCPALPRKLEPLSLDNRLSLGVSKEEVTAKLGAPSFEKDGWVSYDFTGKAAGKCDGGRGFDLSASLKLHFENGRATLLQASQVTSC